MHQVLTFILAGGRGERLLPLTRDRTKPAVPFGGLYRIIDFVLSNCINSGLRKINVLSQYKSHSLQNHLRLGWNFLDPQLGEYIDIIPAQQRTGFSWYRGTADAIYQNIYLIEQNMPKQVLVLAGDHIYRMNYQQIVEFHRKNKADVTIAVTEVSKEQTSQFGIVEIDKNSSIIGFQEKPNQEVKNKKIYASMGIYIFEPDMLINKLYKEISDKDSTFDFGGDILPEMVKNGSKVYAYHFQEGEGKEKGYWRDIGTIDAYYNANMDLVDIEPSYNLYDNKWPIRTHQRIAPPVKTIFSGGQNPERIGLALDSLISNGCIISGGKIQHSILSPNVRINSFSEIYDSILMEGVDVGRYAKIKRAIIDKDVHIPQGAVIGYELNKDRKQYKVTKSGIVVIAKRERVKQ